MQLLIYARLPVGGAVPRRRVPQRVQVDAVEVGDACFLHARQHDALALVGALEQRPRQAALGSTEGPQS